MSSRRKVPRHATVYQQGDCFDKLYAIKLGHFKKYQIAANTPDRVIGFPLAGELLGMEAIFTGRHACCALALDDSEVCEIAFPLLEKLLSDIPALLHHFHCLMSQEITMGQSAITGLGRLHADQRFASFLLNLSAQYTARGYAPDRFLLRMSRLDISSYLALTVETISRLIAQFQDLGLANVINRDVRLLDIGGLTLLSSGEHACARKR